MKVSFVIPFKYIYVVSAAIPCKYIYLVSVFPKVLFANIKR